MPPTIEIINIKYLDAGHTMVNIYYDSGGVDQNVIYPSGDPEMDGRIDDWVALGNTIAPYPGEIEGVRYTSRAHVGVVIYYVGGGIDAKVIYPSGDPAIDGAIAAWVAAGNSIVPFVGVITNVKYTDRSHSVVDIYYDNGNIEHDVAYPGDAVIDAEIDAWLALGNSIELFFSAAQELAAAKTAKINAIWIQAFFRIEKAEAGMNPDNPDTDPIKAKKRELKRQVMETYWLARAIKTGNLSWVTAADQSSATQYMNFAIWANSTRQEASDREDDVSAAVDLAGVGAVTPVWPVLT